ncbi:hypothetical protein L21TH_0491 [Caldisalinibacter kiritimatiensis]|uniref:Uncharacterized protein n=1 Tax=Caldisalinibacter kiritimatiensis TaxID=1304284 RepID=R1CXX4_9FIRM|nr:hypothetical protein L21TH_0491 [Caldisalinibacter kiritimatiensis]
MFYTWHLKEEKLRKIFCNSIEITKPNIIEKVMNFLPAALMLVLPVPLPNPYIKCYIKTRELPESFIQKYILKSTC